LIGTNDNTVVLQRTNREKDLVVMPIARLSKADQEYLKSKEVAEQAERSAQEQQVWTLRNGLKVFGRVVEYGRRDITIQRKRGRVYANDRVLANYPDFQQKMLAHIVAHFEKAEISDERELEKWIVQLRGEPRTGAKYERTQSLDTSLRLRTMFDQLLLQGLDVHYNLTVVE
jgi:hypothetical protein